MSMRSLISMLRNTPEMRHLGESPGDDIHQESAAGRKIVIYFDEEREQYLLSGEPYYCENEVDYVHSYVLWLHEPYFTPVMRANRVIVFAAWGRKSETTICVTAELSVRPVEHLTVGDEDPCIQFDVSY